MSTILNVYFDGLCPLCSKEIDHYRKLKGSENIAFIDICGPQFNAATEGVDPVLVHKVMHAKYVHTNEIKTKMDAFIAIWMLLPKYHWLAALAQKAWIRPVLDIAYICFAQVRPYLKRKDPNCENSPYCDINK